MGLAELYWITGRREYRHAFEHIWWSIVKLDRHNGGGFSSGERASGDPYDRGPIETCCTIAWIAASVEMLKMTGNSIVADEIELSTLNAVVGMHSSTGRWATYNTPMDGLRRASAHSIVFQARAGSPELNCCSVNSPRGFGMIAQWAVMKDADGVLLNYYGPCVLEGEVEPGQTVVLTQVTDYPRSGRIELYLAPQRPCSFSFRLRIPHWSTDTAVTLNGEPIPDVKPGQYLALERTWKEGDRIVLDLDMSPHYWVGQGACAEMASAYRGPLLLAYDHRYNLAAVADRPPKVRDEREWQDGNTVLDMPRLDLSALTLHPMQWDDWLPPWLLLECRAIDGSVVRLCDWGSAGEVGTPYRSWLAVDDLPRPFPFTGENPLRSGRLTES
jgi:DUF1680 family protein